MTRKRYVAVACIFTLLVGVGVAVASLKPPSPGVSKANFDRIQVGMTLTETTAIFGRPCTGAVTQVNDAAFMALMWTNADGDSALIEFKDRRVDEVTGKQWSDSGKGFFATLRRHLATRY